METEIGFSGASLLLDIKPIEEVVASVKEEDEDIEEELRRELKEIKAEQQEPVHEEPEDIFRRKPKAPKKKKRIPSEKQKAHLKRMREKKAEKKRIKQLEKDKEQEEEQNIRINKMKEISTAPKSSQDIDISIPKIEGHGNDMNKFFNQMERFVGLYNKMNTSSYTPLRQEPTKPIPIPIQKPQRRVTRPRAEAQKPKENLYGYDDYF
jgi:hypothetical protein